MADQGKWYKLWVSSDDDPDNAVLSIADFGRWCKLGIYTKAHGTGGRIVLPVPPRGVVHPLVTKFQVESFEDVIACISRFKSCTLEEGKNETGGIVSLVVTWRNWARYQGDFSTERVKQFRAVKRSKRRREEKRIRREKTPPMSSPAGEAPAAAPEESKNGLPDWFRSTLLQSQVFSPLADPRHAAFWKAMGAAYDPYEWLKWDEQIQRADAWIAANPQRKPRDLRRFLQNWFSRAVERGRIHAASKG